MSLTDCPGLPPVRAEARDDGRDLAMGTSCVRGYLIHGNAISAIAKRF